MRAVAGFSTQVLYVVGSKVRQSATRPMPHHMYNHSHMPHLHCCLQPLSPELCRKVLMNMHYVLPSTMLYTT